MDKFIKPSETYTSENITANCVCKLRSMVNILLSDERYLSESNSRSNTGLIKKHLIQKKASKAKFISFYNENMTENEFVNENEFFMHDLLPINVSILGMGEDMHTASLFPDSNELNDALKSNKSLHVVRPRSQPEARISLSGKALASADKTYILILGQEKLKAYPSLIELKLLNLFGKSFTQIIALTCMRQIL